MAAPQGNSVKIGWKFDPLVYTLIATASYITHALIEHHFFETHLAPQFVEILFGAR